MQLIWFLAPTISLCEQQYKVISSQIPAVRSRTITGLDKVNLWTDQNIWDAVLHDVRIVISTHRVLADALGHGFVRMSRLALIVYDEAHHCKKDHPANIVMRDFYHPTLAVHGPENVPHILGLTASPTTGSISQSLSLV
ncbi:hypothetical protein PHISCL_01941 [Aspergillus sclerotialis]|uniref:Helicase ATP-binding domain-containing protein n=1 Tax=Aspergillus sclerotialis TaxID=2070753 RepID=A0A3A2ZTV4_9EURO|nr:hypothetical protein PHISCL_01941 [Aspergillus sclerotialis]